MLLLQAYCSKQHSRSPVPPHQAAFIGTHASSSCFGVKQVHTACVKRQQATGHIGRTLSAKVTRFLLSDSTSHRLLPAFAGYDFSGEEKGSAYSHSALPAASLVQ